ncbi:Uncaracterized surface protein containing fasciclin (FAS1) repeats [Nannocystis exedens]|uniref:Uncaracterized surface protein containing fasciclin (FAS1) repeats n=1 Tax=Nannocystis exedens TaxID=54 RepID=A0A1I1T8C5_9BACT|nr:fasciclin domain-containing protein [Nannocystis exedens]SFD54842.1 Uncaracterized surface protein containing fasciclin (FAS1) repeats [Nannocystis exedens]
MNLRLIALSLLVASASTNVACKKDSASEAPEPAAEAAPPPAPEPEPEAAATPEPEAAPAPEPAPAAKDLATVVAGLEKGKTFQELLVAAELDKDLTSGDVSLTILVPTDEAFAKLPKGTLDKWKKNKEQLQKALKYHFIPGLNDSAKLGNYRTAPTAAGPELPIKQSQDSEMTIDGAKLLEINIPASNGLVHVIDKVLQPPKK